jgi:hypothetical protein
MSFRSFDGRWLAAAVVTVYALVFSLAASTWGIEPALSAAGVSSVGAPFSDLYVFSAAATEFSHGGNPYVSNPSDPWRRTYNYPRVWLLFMRFPFGAVPWLGFAIGAAWLAVLAAYWGRLTPGQGLMAGALVCSPSVLLALERCNSDLLIFILITAALGCLQRGWRGPAWLFLFVSAVLKLYPIAAFSAFFCLGGRQARAWLVGAVVAFGLWAGLHVGEFQAIAHNTPTGGPAVSYGSAVVFSIAEKLHGDRTGEWGAYLGYAWLGGVAAALLTAGMFWVGLRRHWANPDLSLRMYPESARTGGPPVPTFDLALAGFHTGAFIYLATFILGSNFAYRHIFLLLCLPWLWRKEAHFPFPRVKAAATLALVLCLWANPMWWIPLIAVREVAGWSLLAMLACLTGATWPSERSEDSGQPVIPDSSLRSE